MLNRLLRNIFNKYYEVITLVGESVSYLFLYLIGISRYRTILVLSIAGLIRVFINPLNISKATLDRILVVIVIPFLFVDIAKGQFNPIYSNLNIFISIALTLITVFAVNKFLKKSVQKITCNEVFTYCLNCKFENPRLVKICSNCKATVIDFANNDIESTESSDLMSCISNERVVAEYKFSGYHVYKDNNELQVKKMLITNTRTAFIYYKLYSKGWSSIESINNDDICKIVIKDANHNKRAPAPIMLISKSDGTIYELFHYSTDPASISLHEIANCLKEQNTRIEIVL